MNQSLGDVIQGGVCMVTCPVLGTSQLHYIHRLELICDNVMRFLHQKVFPNELCNNSLSNGNRYAWFAKAKERAPLKVPKLDDSPKAKQNCDFLNDIVALHRHASGNSGRKFFVPEICWQCLEIWEVSRVLRSPGKFLVRPTPLELCQWKAESSLIGLDSNIPLAHREYVASYTVYSVVFVAVFAKKRAPRNPHRKVAKMHGKNQPPKLITKSQRFGVLDNDLWMSYSWRFLRGLPWAVLLHPQC